MDLRNYFDCLDWLWQPFVDDDHPLQSLFPSRVWAIRIPVILTLLGSAVVGSFLGMVMIKSNRKKAAKARAAAAKKSKWWSAIGIVFLRY